MKVFKFGGASVRTANAVKNVQSIIERYEGRLFIVVSAMGKTTNAMEEIVQALFDGKKVKFVELVEDRRLFHLNIMDDLFLDKDLTVYQEVNAVFDNLLLQKDKKLEGSYDFHYDQIVSLGEVVSTQIVAAYLALHHQSVCWKDARKIIRTDDKYRAADIDWEATQKLVEQELIASDCDIMVLQGFLGHTKDGFTTTLGREGSDFTAGIIAYCVEASNVTIWKDVPGMLNADPKWFDNTVKLDKISFKEAIELAYYGASVIHPKTVKPLQNKNIPLYIKSFLEPQNEGSIIQESTEHDGLVPSFIFKVDQVLLSITSKDFSFVVEENLSDIFKILADNGVHINLMQNSAVSFTVCIDIDDRRLDALVKALSKEYIVRYNKNAELVTIRHYDADTIERVTQNREILIEQRTRHTARLVMRRK